MLIWLLIKTHHNEEDKVDPVPERVGILDVVHDVGPSLQTNYLQSIKIRNGLCHKSHICARMLVRVNNHLRQFTGMCVCVHHFRHPCLELSPFFGNGRVAGMSVWGEKGRGQRELMRGGRTGVLLCRSILKVCSTIESCSRTQRRERRNSCAPQYPRQSGARKGDDVPGLRRYRWSYIKGGGKPPPPVGKKLLAGSRQKRLTTPKESPPPARLYTYI